MQRTYHPDRSLHTSISCYNYSKQKHTNCHETCISLWISVYGTPQKILVNSGGKLASTPYTEMCDYLGITLQTRAAESIWTTGIVERGNQTLVNMTEKITDIKCLIDLALCWAVNAKNSLQIVAGLIPVSLVLTKQSGWPLDQDFLILLILLGLVKSFKIMIMLNK